MHRGSVEGATDTDTYSWRFLIINMIDDIEAKVSLLKYLCSESQSLGGRRGKCLKVLCHILVNVFVTVDSWCDKCVQTLVDTL